MTRTPMPIPSKVDVLSESLSHFSTLGAQPCRISNQTTEMPILVIEATLFIFNER